MLTLEQVSELYDKLYDYKKEEFSIRGHWNDCYQGKGVDIYLGGYYLGIHFFYNDDKGGWEGTANVYFHDITFDLQKEYFVINDMSQLPALLKYIDKALDTLIRMPSVPAAITMIWEDLWNR